MQRFEITLFGMRFIARGTSGIIGAIALVCLVIVAAWLMPEFRI